MLFSHCSSFSGKVRVYVHNSFTSIHFNTFYSISYYVYDYSPCSSFKIYLFCFMHMSPFTLMYVWVTYACPQRGQRRVSDPLEPELGTVVSCHISAGNQTYVLCKNKGS